MKIFAHFDEEVKTWINSYVRNRDDRESLYIVIVALHRKSMKIFLGWLVGLILFTLFLLYVV